MTLIAHSISFKVPFIVGDILLSNGIRQPFTPPTIFVDISEHLNEPDRKDFPCDLAQKVYIVTPNLAIAFSGVVYEMTKFLKELRYKCNKIYDNKVLPEHIHRFLEDYDLPKNFSESSFFMMLIEHTGNDSIYVSQFNYGNWNSLETELYNEVFANGSGAVSYRNWANDKVEFTSSHEKGDIHFAIQSNVCLITKLLAIERASLATLKKNWGAGFEMVFYTGETFIKFQQIAYLVFQAEFDDEGNFGDPMLAKVMYYEYVNETLVIVSLDILAATYTEKDNLLHINADKLRVGTFPVFPIDLEETPDEIQFANDISFLTYRVGVAYIITKNKESLFIPAFFNEGPELKVEFVQGKSFKITMMLEAMQKVREGAKKSYPQV